MMINGKMIMNDELQGMWNTDFAALFKSTRPVFTWEDWGKSLEISVTIAHIHVDNQSRQRASKELDWRRSWFVGK